MPRGWYLAQGLIPLGYSSSDDEEGPCELPNGRLVCGPHGLVQCGRCCSDYSFMDDVLNEHHQDSEDGDDADTNQEQDTIEVPAGGTGYEKIRGTGLVFPSKFTPSSESLPPMELFRGKFRFMNVVRCTYPNDNSAMVITADGSCLNNGVAKPKGGWAFCQGLNLEGEPLLVSGRLEDKGPWGNEEIQSSNRAELRAVIAALRFRHWRGEGFCTVVIATDSEYVVQGSTQWAKTWVQNGWKTSHGSNVRNKDMWEALLGECERAHQCGLAIQFWRIPREWNTLADESAKKAAALENIAMWTDCIGLAC